jgi:hypothetical protein
MARSGQALTVTPQGLAVLLAGGATAAVMRRAGLIAGPPGPADAVLDVIMAGPQPAILDFF